MVEVFSAACGSFFPLLFERREAWCPLLPSVLLLAAGFMHETILAIILDALLMIPALIIGIYSLSCSAIW